MLSDEQLNKILNKEVWEPEDIYLIHHHLDEIEKMNSLYGSRLPADVAITTNIDIGKIADRCKKYMDSGEQHKTVDLLVKKGVDLEKMNEELEDFYHNKLLKKGNEENEGE